MVLEMANWEGELASGQYDHSYAEKNPTETQFPVKIESMDRFAQARRQGDRTSSDSQSTLLKNIAKRGSNRAVPKGRNGPYPPVQTTLKLERKFRKNTREKQRRQELNEKFDTLCSLLHLGRKTKAEKFTILSEAINSINALRRENAALKREKTKLYRLLQRGPNANELGSSPLRSQQPQSSSFVPNFPSSSTALGLTATSDGFDDGPGPDDPDGITDMEDDTNLNGNQNNLNHENLSNEHINNDDHEQQNEKEIKLNLKLTMETDDTIDIPLETFPTPQPMNHTTNNHMINSNPIMNTDPVNRNHGKMKPMVPKNQMNGLHMNGPKGGQGQVQGQGEPPPPTLNSPLNSNNIFLPLNSPLKFEHFIADSPLPIPLPQTSHPSLLPPLPRFDFDIPPNSIENFSNRRLSPTSARLDSPFAISLNF